MSSLIFTSTEAKGATAEQLAQSILDNSDGRPMSDGFMRVAAIELAKRIVDGKELPILPRERNRSQGEAAGRTTKAIRTAGASYE